MKLEKRNFIGVFMKLFSILGISAMLIIGFFRFFFSENPKPKEQEVILDWYNFALECDRYAEGYKGAISARTFAYLGLANVEIAGSIHPISLDFLKFQETYPHLPVWKEDFPLFLPAALNASFAYLFEMFYSSVPMHLKEEIYNKNIQWHSEFIRDIDSQILHKSIKFGREIASLIFEFAATDTLGHNAHLFNYDRSYTIADKLGAWTPCRSFPMPPLLPHWGKARTFVVDANQFLAQPLPAFSYDKASTFHKQALEVFTLNSPLSNENQWIAEFWSDDLKSNTFTPAARWISVTNQVVKKENISTEKLLNLYLEMGLVLNDAFVSCWYSKYHYNLMRPETYIQKIFDKSWHSHYHSPSFPGYPSGHSFAGAASCAILSNTFGNNYSFSDRSHVGRKDFKSKPRSFNSFDEMAQENAISRVLLGVHFRIDSEEGLKLGKELGNFFLSVKNNEDNAMKWNSKPVHQLN